MAADPPDPAEFTKERDDGAAPGVGACVPWGNAERKTQYRRKNVSGGSCAIMRGRGDSIRHPVHRQVLPRVCALLCFLGYFRTARPRLPEVRNNSAVCGDITSDHTVGDFAFMWTADALEEPVKQQGRDAYAPADSKSRQLTEILSGLGQGRLPEGMLESLQSVDWGSLVSTGAAGLEVAVAEGRQYLKEWMQSGRVQELLRTLQVEKLEDSLRSLLENLGLKEKFPEQLMRERRTLETSFVPIFVFARERVLERSRDEEEAALKIALGDPQLKAAVKQFEDVSPARSMSTAPSTLDAMHENLLKVATVLINSRPVALSLALRVELLTQEFVEYCKSVFSALTRYISFVNRFHKNRRALFFFAQHTLPRVLKILLLLNRLEDHFLQRARSDFAESAERSAELRREAKRLAAPTAALITSLGNIAHGCLAATSPPFQVDFAKALSAYDHGENPLVAFKSFVEAPKELIGQKESMFQQRQHRHATARSTLPQLERAQTTKQHEERGMRAEAALSDHRGNAPLDNNELRGSRGFPREEARQDLSALGAPEYIHMMRKHLQEVSDSQQRYADETPASSHLRQVPIPEIRGGFRGGYGTSRETPLQHVPSSTIVAGTPGSLMDMEALLNASPRLFVAPASASVVGRVAPEASSDLPPTTPAGVVSTDASSRGSANPTDETAAAAGTGDALAGVAADSVPQGIAGEGLETN